MLELKLPENAYGLLDENEPLLFVFESRSVDEELIGDIGSVIAREERGFGICTHLQSNWHKTTSDGYDANKLMLSFPLSDDQHSCGSSTFGRGDLSYNFRIRKSITAQYEGHFHVGDTYCLELSTHFSADSQETLDSQLKEYFVVLNRLFEHMYGEKAKDPFEIKYDRGGVHDGFMVRELSDISSKPGEKEKSGFGGCKQAYDGEQTQPDTYEITDPNVGWDDIGGLDKQKDLLKLTIGGLLDPQILRFFGKDPKKQGGYLISGPTGCGKTMLTRALETEAKEKLGDRIKIYAPTYGDMTSTLRGGESMNFAYLFDHLSGQIQNGFYVMLVLEEFQTMGQRYKRRDGNNEALNELLLQIERFNAHDRALFIATTAQPLRSFDPQIIRPGRFDTTIEVGIPKREASIKILDITTKQRRQYAAEQGDNLNLFGGDIDYETITRKAKRFPSAQLIALFDDVIMDKRLEYIVTNNTKPITTRDILAKVPLRRKRIRQSSSRNRFFYFLSYLRDWLP